jgi:hypothetical protein
LLLNDLEAGQQTKMYEMTNADLNQLSEVKKQKRWDRFGQYIIIGLVVPFLADDQTLANLL